ncbi:tyrosine-type recombinase/integrase [Rhodovarius sp.]|uniref:tyrosine-type recombinase/integrase n=1 Tax=Rhodovarius sp. TaxID=2972673 RepID=UPI00333FD12B
MVIKKQDFDEDEVLIFDEAIVYKRGDYWQFRMWLRKEGKYARRSLGTRNRTTAIEKGKELYLELLANLKQGKTYFSIDAKKAVELYVAHRQKDVEVGLIVPGRLGTIRAHLKNWLDFIGRDTKLKEMERTDCESYFHFRVKGADRTAARQVTVQNEQSTINAMMDWLFKRGEARIDAFDFRKLPRIDTRDDAIRRATFDDEEIAAIHQAIDQYCDRKAQGLEEREWLMRSAASQFFRMAAMSGLRVGELMQLTWHDIWWRGHFSKKKQKLINLVNVSVRADTSKTRKSRELYFQDDGYLKGWRKLIVSTTGDHSEKGRPVFASDGKTPITKRALYYHFDKVLQLAGIDRTDRALVPYSFRHYFITERITAGLSYQQVAEMCGTSVAQIERTYFHLNDEARVSHAIAGYEIADDGLDELDDE